MKNHLKSLLAISTLALLAPLSVLAAEAGIPYATVALVTDYDAGVDGHAPVTLDEVFAVMRRNVATVREVLAAALATLP